MTAQPGPITTIINRIRAFALGFCVCLFIGSLFLNVLLITRPGLVEYVTDPAPFEHGYSKQARAQMQVTADVLGGR